MESRDGTTGIGAPDGDRERGQAGGPASGLTARAEALTRILDGYLSDLGRGLAPNREAFLEQNPEFRRELERCLPCLEFIRSAQDTTQDVPKRLGDFEIVREIGRGGMGVVYEAEQVSLKRRVALKVLKFAELSDRHAMDRFQREALTLALLHHTHIVPILSVGSDEGVSYFAMQFIEGRDAAQILREDKRIDARTAARWGLEIAEALEYAHRRGVIHRDVKPSNILIDGAGESWLTDFGVARRLEDPTLSMAGMVLGTLSYMSPEQARVLEEPVDHRSDIYSLGVTLYELTTGEVPFRTRSPGKVLTNVELLSKIRDEDPEPPRKRRRELPRDLETVILKCLNKSPSGRFSTAGELAANLRAFLESRPLTIRKYGPCARARRWLTRRSAGISLVARVLTALGLLLGAAALLWQTFFSMKEARFRFEPSGQSVQLELWPLGHPEKSTWPRRRETVTLPPGPYTGRLRRVGRLTSEIDLDLGVDQRETRSLTLRYDLSDQPLWPSQSALEASEAVNLGEGLRILAVTDTGMKCVEAATGAIRWACPLVADPLTASAFLAAPFPDALEGPLLTDLDGDGVLDPISASHARPALLAVSGKDGKLLWCYQSPCEKPEEACVFGEPSLARLGPERAAHLIVTLQARREPQEFWIEAVPLLREAPRAPLWRFGSKPAASAEKSAQKNAEQAGSDSADSALGPASLRPLVSGDEPKAVIASRRAIRILDPGSGRILREMPVEGSVVSRLACLDLDRDGRLEGVFVTREPTSAEGGQTSWTLRLRVVTLESGAELWAKVSLGPGGEDRPLVVGWDGQPASSPGFLAKDLDGDGRPEIAAAETGADGTESVILLDGATGAVRWKECLGQASFAFRSAYTAYSPRVFAIPDMDGDGARDLGVLRVEEKRVERGAYRSDSPLLWLSTRREAERRIGRTEDVPVVGALATGADIRVLSWTGSGLSPDRVVVSDGYQSHVIRQDGGKHEELPGAARTRVADLDGDGLDDIYFIAAERLEALRGATRELWRRRALWVPVEDLDGDGYREVLEKRNGPARVASGRTGRLLSTGPTLRLSDSTIVTRSDGGDIDGDDIPDLLLLEAPHAHDVGGADSTVRVDHCPVVAASGRDGRLLWSHDAELEGSFDAYIAPASAVSFASPRDIDRDGRSEVLFVTAEALRKSRGEHASPGSPIRVSVFLFEGGSGKARWTLTLDYPGSPAGLRLFRTLGLGGGEGAERGRRGRLFPEPAILSGGGDAVDRVLLALPAYEGEATAAWQLSCRDGGNGREVWRAALPLPLSEEPPTCEVLEVFGFDLDADGGDEVYVTARPGGNAGARPAGWLACLDPKTGGILSVKSWELPDPSDLSDLSGRTAVLRWVSPGGRRLLACAGQRGTSPWISVLGAGGRTEIELEGRLLAPASGSERGACCGLLYEEKGLLRYREDPARESWAVGIPAEGAALDGILGEGPGAVLVLRSEPDLLGLSAATGKVLWRSHASRSPELLATRPGSVPLIASHPGDGDSTVCKEALVFTGSLRRPWAPAGAPEESRRRARSTPFSDREFEGIEWVFLAPPGVLVFAYFLGILPVRILRSLRKEQSRARRRAGIAYLLALGTIPPALALLLPQFGFRGRASPLAVRVLLNYVLLVYVAVVSFPLYVYWRALLRALIHGPWSTLAILLLANSAGLVLFMCIQYAANPESFERFLDVWTAPWPPAFWVASVFVAGWPAGIALSLHLLWKEALRPCWAWLRRKVSRERTGQLSPQ